MSAVARPASFEAQTPGIETVVLGGAVVVANVGAVVMGTTGVVVVVSLAALVVEVPAPCSVVVDTSVVVAGARTDVVFLASLEHAVSAAIELSAITTMRRRGADHKGFIPTSSADAVNS